MSDPNTNDPAGDGQEDPSQDTAPGTGDATQTEEGAAAPETASEAGGEEPVPDAETLKAQVVELADQLLRARAETENVRKRAERERADALRYGITNFARDALSVADNLRRAIESVSDEAREGSEELRALLDGVEMTERELAAAFERHGIKAIEPMGEKFDPNLHQAMFEVADTGEPDGTVVQVVQTGYVIDERLLRPAMVGVAKNAKGGGPPPTGGTPGSTVDTKA